MSREAIWGALLLSPLLHPRQHLALGLESLVPVVLQHPPREAPDHGFDNVLALASLEQISDHRVTQIQLLVVRQRLLADPINVVARKAQFIG